MSSWSILSHTVRHNFHKELQQEFKLNPKLFLLVDEFRGTLLMTAAAYNAYECLQVLVNLGEDVNKKNYFGRTALMFAVISCNFKSAEYLIQQGADITPRTNDSDESAFGLVLKHVQKDRSQWFNLFEPHKDQFDAEDSMLYNENRLASLFI